MVALIAVKALPKKKCEQTKNVLRINKIQHRVKQRNVIGHRAERGAK